MIIISYSSASGIRELTMVVVVRVQEGFRLDAYALWLMTTIA